jgi:3-oxoacyl-[acyl-carrier protein] reductase
MSNCRLLSGKVALITGCSRGIGKTILENFALNGATIWACARKETKEFDQFLNALKLKYDVPIYPVYFDLTNESEVKEQMKQLVINNIRIDILINNAGVAHGGYFQLTSINQIRQVFEINFFSQLLITQYIAKIMIKQKCGSIINMASVAGIDANMGNSAYGSSKAALIYYTKTIAKEYAQYNIRVNAVAPGLTETDMADNMEKKAREAMISSSAMNRLAQPTEIADVVLFLASGLSSFVTGQVIRVDGGI